LAGRATDKPILYVMICRNNKKRSNPKKPTFRPRSLTNFKSLTPKKPAKDKALTILIQTDFTTNYHQIIAKNLFPLIRKA
jgi:hypothetical protein